MGPEGGNRGGKVIGYGSPEKLVKEYSDISYTSKYLKDELESFKN
jgi:excinuclease UvrABC ATPase subunit